MREIQFCNTKTISMFIKSRSEADNLFDNEELQKTYWNLKFWLN